MPSSFHDPSFHVTVEIDGDRATATVTGELDVGTAGRLREALAGPLVQAAPLLRLDLAGVSFIDSTGLRVVVELAQLAGGRRVEIVSGAAVHHVIDLAGLRPHLPIA